MAYEDRNLTCVECGQTFVFSADDQSYHALKGYTNEPKRCPNCRQERRRSRNDSGSGSSYGSASGFGGGYDRGPREMHPAVCADCGKETTVPFRPRGDRPVYCSDCYSKRGGRTTSTRSSRF